MAIVALAVFATPLVYGEAMVYKLEANERTFDITYELDGRVIAMEVDSQSTSLLIGVDNVWDSIFTVSFPSEVLAAYDADFIVLVDGFETDYLVTYDGNNPTISFPVQALTEEIEIIGTSAIPEFPLGALAIMGMVSSALIFLTRRNSLFK